jgi:hypothetical protein
MAKRLNIFISLTWLKLIKVVCFSLQTIIVPTPINSKISYLNLRFNLEHHTVEECKMKNEPQVYCKHEHFKQNLVKAIFFLIFKEFSNEAI